MKRLFHFLRAVAEGVLSVMIYLVGIVHFLIGAVVILLIGFFTTGKLFETAINTFSKLIVVLAGIRVKVEGRHHIEDGKKYIVMMNHVNIFDAFVFKSSFKKRARGIEEESHMNWPVYGFLMKRIGMIPINRKNARKAMESLKAAAERLNEQKDLSVGIMPEGTRTITGKLGPFKKGGFLLAIESGLDIIPVIQTGSYRIKKKTSWLIRPGRMKVIIEKPVPTKGYTRGSVNELIEKVRNIMLRYTD